METVKKFPMKWEQIITEKGFMKRPVIKATYKLYGIRCNLVFGGCASVATSQFIESLLNKQKMCK